MNKAVFKMAVFVIIVFTGHLIPFVSANENRYKDLPPDKVAMLHYKSRIDGTSQPLLIKTPADYSVNKSWPLLVVLHGLGDGPILAPRINSMIQIGPYGRGDKWYKGIGEKDVLESIEFAKTVLAVNDNKIYLTGFSMGGYGTLNLASRFPGLWAACVPVCPRVPENFRLENCSNLPVWIHTGQKDYTLPPEPCAKLYKTSQKKGLNGWLYTEHKGMGHSFNINWKDVEAWLLKHRRDSIPNNIDFKVEDFASNCAYWVKIKSAINSQKAVSVKGKIEDNHINVLINNISSLKIDFSGYNNENCMKTKRIVIRDSKKIVCSGILKEDNTFDYNSKNN